VIRKIFPLALLAILLSMLSLPAQALGVPRYFTFTGAGFGHGVGLSQIGAKGQALSGKSAQDILQYYFPGTTLNTVDDSSTIRVNLAHQVTTVSVTLNKAFPDGKMQVIPGDIPMDSPSNFPYLTKPTVTFTLIDSEAAASTAYTTAPVWTVRWSGTSALAGPDSVVNVNAPGTSLSLHYGQIQVRTIPVSGQGYRIEVTDTMRLGDEYMYGVGEVRAGWPIEAIKAQVIASRTYALAHDGPIRPLCDCNVYSSKYDQVYIGYAKELDPNYLSNFKTAVDQTRGMAIYYQGSPINVYFSSSTGGFTQRSQDVWGTPFPYLVSVPDPWSLDSTLNPGYARWVRKVSQSDISSAFGLPNIVRVKIGARTQTDSVLYVTGYSLNGRSKTLPVGTFKTAVHLPSSWFH
jgi:stage II sporulation protein D